MSGVGKSAREQEKKLYQMMTERRRRAEKKREEFLALVFPPGLSQPPQALADHCGPG